MQKIIRLALMLLLLAALTLANTRLSEQTAESVQSSTKADEKERKVVIDAGQASTSLLQRRCKLGYARAARIMDEMEEKGIIGPYEGAKPRAVLISRQQWLEMQMNQPDE